VRLALAFFVTAAALAVPSRAVAVETEGDVETDHIDAADDGGPRSVGVLVHPLAMAAAWLGAEVDVACGSNVVMSVGGEERWVFGTRGERVAVGLALYPQRFSFHGIYVHPLAMWQRAPDGGGGPANVFGAGVTVGYAWTWPFGATVRLGGGAAYVRSLASDRQANSIATALRPQVDGDVGWVF
jgi:hypothetical protein